MPGKSNNNLVFDNIEISHVGSYGMGAEYGDYLNNRYSNLYIHDVGADAIDQRCGWGLTSGPAAFPSPTSWRDDLGCGSAGLDLRGPAQIVNFQAIDFAAQDRATAGIIFEPGIFDEGEGGIEPSAFSSLSNFLIDAGDPSVTDSTGVIVANSESTVVANGTIRNCGNAGVTVGNASTGFPIARNAKIVNVTVEGTRLKSFEATTMDVSFVNCTARGAVDTFEKKRGNLEEGKTVFNTPRPHDVATVQVFKNSALLAGGGVNYTVNDSDTITLTAGVAIADLLEVVTPGGTGFYTSGVRTTMALCQTQHVTTPQANNAGALATLMRVGNSFPGSTYAPLDSPIFTGTVTIPTLNVSAIMQAAWTDLALANSWVNFGTPFQTAQYRKDAQSRVHLRGLIKSGTTADATQICTALPSGYRPAATVIFGVPYNNGALNLAEIRIASSGAVSIFFATGTAAYLSLSGISFSV